eukprot:2199236-Amphidinium_carterae.1
MGSVAIFPLSRGQKGFLVARCEGQEIPTILPNSRIPISIPEGAGWGGSLPVCTETPIMLSSVATTPVSPVAATPPQAPRVLTPFPTPFSMSQSFGLTTPIIKAELDVEDVHDEMDVQPIIKAELAVEDVHDEMDVQPQLQDQVVDVPDQEVMADGSILVPLWR